MSRGFKLFILIIVLVIAAELGWQLLGYDVLELISQPSAENSKSLTQSAPGPTDSGTPGAQTATKAPGPQEAPGTPAADKTLDQHAASHPQPHEPVEDLDREALEKWQAQAGFLLGAEFDEYMGMNIERLRQLANGGDVMAKSALGVRQFKLGEAEQAEQTLTDAVADGSLGAAVWLRNLYANGNTDLGIKADQSRFYTWLRISELMGYPPMMGSVIFPNAHTEALAKDYYYQTLQWLEAEHLKRFGTYLPFIPRPEPQG